MRAVMICDFDNPISVAYSKIAKQTWRDVNVDLELWQCYTPKTYDTNPFNLKWSKYSSTGKNRVISLTEKCCFTSMFYWWHHIATTGEQVIILEHDAYVLDCHKLNMLIKQIPDHEFWCCGIAAECISISQRYGEFLMNMWLNNNVEVTCGPLGELMRHNVDYGKKYIDTGNLGITTACTSNRDRTLGSCKVYSHKHVQAIVAGTIGLQRAPVTQCYYPGKTTINHRGKIDLYKDHERHRHMLLLADDPITISNKIN